SQESQCRSWNRKFATYPHLAEYVTRLEVRNATVFDETSFLESAETLEFVLRLSKVKHLEMQCFDMPSKKVIERLGLYEGDLLDLLSQMVYLKDLTIADVDVRGSNKGLVGPAPHNYVDAVPTRLRNLELHTTESLYIFSWLSGGAFALDDLTSLTLVWYYLPATRRGIGIHFPSTPQVSSYLDPFIKTASAAIKHLRLEIEGLEYRRDSEVNFMQGEFNKH
ncbi:hypothetical protein IW261DRAFT_1454847, partial [Armillaria novae-zelandiae]